MGKRPPRKTPVNLATLFLVVMACAGLIYILASDPLPRELMPQ